MIRVESERWRQSNRESILPPKRRLIHTDENDFISFIEDIRVDIMTDKNSPVEF